MPTSATYGSVAKFLHWTLALLLLGMIVLGAIMNDLPRTDPLKFTLFQLHKSIGIALLLLSVLRLGWRWAHPAPPLPAGMPAWERWLAKTIVVVFYALMIGIPFLGWAVVSTSPLNIPTVLFGIIPWPHLPILPTLANKKELSETLGELHGFLAYAVLALLALHVGGALKHHFISRDDVLTRMAPEGLSRFLNRLRSQGKI
jgi:cytochrome b561